MKNLHRKAIICSLLLLCVGSLLLFFGCGEGFRSHITSYAALTEKGKLPVDDIDKFPSPGDIDYNNPASDRDVTEPDTDSDGGTNPGDGTTPDTGDISDIDATSCGQQPGRYFRLELLNPDNLKFDYAIHTRLNPRVVPLTLNTPKRVVKDCKANKEPIKDSDISAHARPNANGAEICVKVTVYEGDTSNLKIILEKKVCQRLK